MQIRPHLIQFESKGYARRASIPEEGLLDCALGKNNFGVSQRVLELAKQYDWSELWETPGTYEDLKVAICRFWSDYAKLEVDNIKIENGSLRVLERFNRIFIERGARVLGYAPQFPGYVSDVIISGGKYEAVLLNPEDNFRFKIDRFISEIQSDYCLVYIDNPNNPTGQLISLSDIEEIVKEARRKGVITLVDEAYGDYVGREHSAVHLINEYSNLAVTRTFTKGYGIGKFRVGYGVFPSELSYYYDKVALVFPISTMASHLASEALLDQDFIQQCRRWVKDEKKRVIEVLTTKGYLIGETCEYCPIFILGHRNEEIDLRQDLLSKGILSVPGEGFVNFQKNFVRINLPREPKQLLDCFREQTL